MRNSISNVVLDVLFILMLIWAVNKFFPKLIPSTIQLLLEDKK